MSEMDFSALWIPQPGPQRALYELPLDIDEVCMGGARGGGKTDAGIGFFIRHMAVNPNHMHHCKGLVLRRTINDLQDMTDRAGEIFKSEAKFWKATRTFEFRNGATIQFTYLERDQDAKNRFQGRDFTFIWFEECGQFYDDRPLNIVKASLRSRYPINKSVLYTCNPGGPGHAWIKERFIDPNPLGFEAIEEHVELPGGKSTIERRMFIPSFTEENKILLENDPNYQAKIKASAKGDPVLERAWLYGDWDITAGGMWEGAWNRQKHVIPDIVDVPMDWKIFRSYDWGSSSPFCILWCARVGGMPARMSDGTLKYFPYNSLVVLDEWYGAKKDVKDEGLGMLEYDIADRVLEREKRRFPGHTIIKGVADVNLFTRGGDGRRLSDEWKARGVWWAYPDKQRINGWVRCRELLVNSKEDRPEKEGLYICSACKYLLKFFPTAPRSEADREDMDPDWEDHACDALRYAVMHKLTGGISYTEEIV